MKEGTITVAIIAAIASIVVALINTQKSHSEAKVPNSTPQHQTEDAGRDAAPVGNSTNFSRKFSSAELADASIAKWGIKVCQTDGWAARQTMDQLESRGVSKLAAFRVGDYTDLVILRYRTEEAAQLDLSIQTEKYFAAARAYNWHVSMFENPQIVEADSYCPSNSLLLNSQSIVTCKE